MARAMALVMSLFMAAVFAVAVLVITGVEKALYDHERQTELLSRKIVPTIASND